MVLAINYEVSRWKKVQLQHQALLQAHPQDHLLQDRHQVAARVVMKVNRSITLIAMKETYVVKLIVLILVLAVTRKKDVMAIMDKNIIAFGMEVFAK